MTFKSYDTPAAGTSPECLGRGRGRWSVSAKRARPQESVPSTTEEDQLACQPLPKVGGGVRFQHHKYPLYRSNRGAYSSGPERYVFDASVLLVFGCFGC